MKEKWKDIEGTSGMYQVSNTGKVRSMNYNNTKESKELTGKVDRYGYSVVSYRENGKRIWRTVHRLVATAFLPNPENKPQVNHIDCNKLNNNVDNLEWCNQAENSRHAMKYGLLDNLFEGSRKAQSQKKLPVVLVKLDDMSELYFDSCLEAQKTTGVKISKLLSGDNVSGMGYAAYEPTGDAIEDKYRRCVAVEHAVKFGGKGANKRKAVIVTRISDGEEIAFDSISDAISFFPEKPCFNDILFGKIKQSKGYTVRYTPKGGDAHDNT